jgi:ZIP family zinc transporter
VLLAVLFGLAASSALVIGAAAGARFSPPRRVTGVLLAFASSALISALAFELFEEAFHLGGAFRAGWVCSPARRHSSWWTPRWTAT